jgi:hypothetical protein
MTLYYVNTGSGPNVGDGDSLRTAFNKINANFSQINTGTLGAVLVQSPSVPQGYGQNTLWYDTESGRTYIYYNGIWVDASPNSNQQSTIAVGLYDPGADTYSSTYNTVKQINFDSLADFSLTDQGDGNVLVGMNSTFKYINIEGQTGLTAQGVDTLNLVAGTGTAIVLSNQGIKNQQTITFINTATGTGSGTATFPPTDNNTPGYLYNDGFDHITWSAIPYADQLQNGSYTFKLNSDGSFTFNGGTQSKAYKEPLQSNSSNIDSFVLFRGNDGSLQYSSGFYYNPNSGTLSKLKKLTFFDNTVQSTAWPGFISTLTYTSGANKYTISLSNTLKLSPGVSVTFPDLSVQTTAFTGTVDWSNLTSIPTFTTSTLNNNGFTATLSTDGSFTIPNVLYVPNSVTNVLSIYGDRAGGKLATLTTQSNLTIITTSSTKSYSWSFNNDGTITFPDNSIQYSAIKSVYDSIFSGTKYLSVTSEGIVKFPDGTGQTTAFNGTAASLNNNGFKLRPVSVPTDLTYGSPSDRAGDIAFDEAYIYYCLSPQGYRIYTTATLTGGTNLNNIRISQASTNLIQPQAGWTVQQQNSSTVYTITGPAQSGSFNNGVGYWQIPLPVSLTYTTGTIFTVTNTTAQANWTKTSLINTGVITKTSKFVDLNYPVSTSKMSFIWQDVSGNGTNINLLVSAYSGQLANVVINLTAGVSNVINNSTQVINTLTAIPVIIGPYCTTPGDLIKLEINCADSNFYYRVTAMAGINFRNNFISIEQLQ